jgi:hypothetical protein
MQSFGTAQLHFGADGPCSIWSRRGELAIWLLVDRSASGLYIYATLDQQVIDRHEAIDLRRRRRLLLLLEHQRMLAGTDGYR